MSDAPHVLIVDDKQSAHDTLESLLLREDYRLSYAFSGPEALEAFSELTPDVMLLDVMMPGMDGFETCRRIKADPATRHVPVILVTALDTAEDLAQGFEAGADDFLHKPVNGIELRARVRSMLRIKKQYDELQSTIRLREELSGMLVHDIRKPLSRILALSEVMTMRTPPGERPETEPAQIRSEVLELNALLQDMLTLTHIESHHLRLNRTSQPVKDVLVQAIGDVQAVATFRSVNIRVGLPAVDVQADIDADVMRTVFESLLVYAVRSAPMRGDVDVRLVGDTEGASSFVLTIADHGATLDEKLRKRLFDNSRGADAPSEGLAHLAVGLSFCRSAVREHGGQLTAEANAPSGTVFRLSV